MRICTYISLYRCCIRPRSYIKAYGFGGGCVMWIYTHKQSNTSAGTCIHPSCPHKVRYRSICLHRENRTKKKYIIILVCKHGDKRVVVGRIWNVLHAVRKHVNVVIMFTVCMYMYIRVLLTVCAGDVFVSLARAVRV